MVTNRDYIHEQTIDHEYPQPTNRGENEEQIREAKKGKRKKQEIFIGLKAVR
jgi:hypothetical protein